MSLMSEVYNESEYQDGLISGYIDGCIIDQPANTGEHTYEFYSHTSDLYLKYIDPFASHSPYEYGYANGFDLAAIYTSASRGERWQDRGKENVP